MDRINELKKLLDFNSENTSTLLDNSSSISNSNLGYNNNDSKSNLKLNMNMYKLNSEDQKQLVPNQSQITTSYQQQKESDSNNSKLKRLEKLKDKVSNLNNIKLVNAHNLEAQNDYISTKMKLAKNNDLTDISDSLVNLENKIKAKSNNKRVNEIYESNDNYNSNPNQFGIKNENNKDNNENQSIKMTSILENNENYKNNVINLKNDKNDNFNFTFDTLSLPTNNFNNKSTNVNIINTNSNANMNAEINNDLQIIKTVYQKKNYLLTSEENRNSNKQITFNEQINSNNANFVSNKNSCKNGNDFCEMSNIENEKKEKIDTNMNLKCTDNKLDNTRFSYNNSSSYNDNSKVNTNNYDNLDKYDSSNIDKSNDNLIIDKNKVNNKAKDTNFSFLSDKLDNIMKKKTENQEKENVLLQNFRNNEKESNSGNDINKSEVPQENKDPFSKSKLLGKFSNNTINSKNNDDLEIYPSQRINCIKNNFKNDSNLYKDSNDDKINKFDFRNKNDNIKMEKSDIDIQSKVNSDSNIKKSYLDKGFNTNRNKETKDNIVINTNTSTNLNFNCNKNENENKRNNNIENKYDIGLVDKFNYQLTERNDRIDDILKIKNINKLNFDLSKNVSPLFSPDKNLKNNKSLNKTGDRSNQISQININDKNLNGILKDYLNTKYKINSENNYNNEKINMNLNMSLEVDSKHKKSYLKEIDMPIKNNNENIHNFSFEKVNIKSEKKNTSSNSLIDKINKMKNNTLSIGKDKENEYFGSVLTPVKILDWLYLGNKKDSENLDLLKKHKIQAILNVSIECRNEFPHIFEYKKIPICDTIQTNIKFYFNDATNFLENCRQKGKNVLVHCYMGRSRSTSSIIAYFIRYKNLSYESAFLQIKTSKPDVQPNSGFICQLKEYENEVKKSNNNNHNIFKK